MAKKTKGKQKQEERPETSDVNPESLPTDPANLAMENDPPPSHPEPQPSTWATSDVQGWGSNVENAGESWEAGTHEQDEAWGHSESLLQPPPTHSHSILPTIHEQPSSGHFTHNRTALSDVGESQDEYSDEWGNQQDSHSPHGQAWDGQQSQTLTATVAPSAMGSPAPPPVISIAEAAAVAQKDMQKQQKISSASEAARKLEESRAHLNNGYSTRAQSTAVSPAVHYEALRAHSHATQTPTGNKPISIASVAAAAMEPSTNRRRVPNPTNAQPSNPPQPGKTHWTYPKPFLPGSRAPAKIEPDPSWTMTGGNAWSNKHRHTQSASAPTWSQGNQDSWNQQLHQYREALQHAQHAQQGHPHPAQQRPRHSKHHSHPGHPTQQQQQRHRPQPQQNQSWQEWGKEGWDQGHAESESEDETMNEWGNGTQHGGNEWGQPQAAWGQQPANLGKNEGKRERGRGHGHGRKPEEEWGQGHGGGWGQGEQGGGQGWDQGNAGWGQQQGQQGGRAAGWDQANDGWGQQQQQQQGQETHQQGTWGQGGETWGQEDSGRSKGDSGRGHGAGDSGWGKGATDSGRGKGAADSGWGKGATDSGWGKGAADSGGAGDSGWGNGATDSGWGKGAADSGWGKGAGDSGWDKGGSDSGWGKGGEAGWGTGTGEWGGGTAPSNAEWGANAHAAQQSKVTFASAEAAGTRNVVSPQQRSQILNSLLNQQPQNQKPHNGNTAHNAAQQATAAKKVQGQQKANVQHDKWGGGAWEAQDNGWGSMDDEEDQEDYDDNRRVHFSPKASDIWGGSPRSIPSKTVAHAHAQQGVKTTLINDASNVRFVESRGAAFDFVSEAFFGNARLARERIHWLFPTNKDERVANMLAWVQKMSFNLGTYGLMKFLEHRERGALFVNTLFRMHQHPREPAFDYLTFNHLQGTMDKVLQESVAFYDPAQLVIVFVYLPSETGNSVAIWRRKVNVPDNARLKYQAEVNTIVKTLRKDKEYIVMVDELPPKPKTVPQKPGQLRKSAPAKANSRGAAQYKAQGAAEKKKRKWWKLFLS